MGTLTRADYQTRVLLALGNVATSHPQISAGMHTTAIDNAANRLILLHPDLFPEYHNYTWTVGPTVAGDNTIALPTSPPLLELDSVTSNETDTTPSTTPGDWSESRETPVVIPADANKVIAYSSKLSTDTGYPKMAARQGTLLLYWPTTRTGYVCYLRVRGTRGETALASSSSTFDIPARYDHIIVLMAAEEVATLCRWFSMAQGFRDRYTEELQSYMPAALRERVRRSNSIRPAGMPRW